MPIRSLAGPALAAALLGAAVATAQTTAAPVTDVGPPPAEERSSTGAVVLEQSPVQAQKKTFAESTAKSGAGPVGRGALRATSRARTRADLANVRAAESQELRVRDSLTGK